MKTGKTSYEHNEENVAPADYEDEIDEELEVIHEEWGRWYRMGILTEANMTEEQKEYFKDALKEAKESSPLVMQQKRMSSILEAFDDKLSELERESKSLDKSLEELTVKTSKRVVSDIIKLKSFIDAVNNRTSVNGSEGLSYRGNPCPYDFKIPLEGLGDKWNLYVNYAEGIAIQMYDPSKSKFISFDKLICADEFDGCMKYLFENWSTIKKAIVDEAEKTLNNYLEKKTEENTKKKESIKKLSERD